MSTAKIRPDHGADPWWGESDAPVATPSPTQQRPARRRHVRTRSPWWMRLLRLPFVLFGRAVRRSPGLRKALVRLAILTIVVVAVAGSIGVILINNVVIHRTAELGKLDTERRQLQRDNAVLDAQAAVKSSQTQIVNHATHLGMQRTSAAPIYEYLDPQSSDLAAKQRAARAAKAERIAQAAKLQAEQGNG